MGKPYIYTTGASFPGKRPRAVRLGALVSDQGITRNLFRDDEWAWVVGRYAELIADPSRWVDTGIALTMARARGLAAHGTTNTRRGFGGRVIVTRSYSYGVQFLAWYQVSRSVFFDCLQPAYRARFAYELRARPYDAELLRGNPYTSSVIAGVLAENPGPRAEVAPAGATVTVVLVQCRHCHHSFEYTNVACPWCGAPR
jgi:hypothetical protein